MFPDDPFHRHGCRILRAGDLAEAHEAFKHHAPALVFLPLKLGSEPVLACLKSCLEHAPDTTVIVVADNSQINVAADAMRIGAFDCLFTPFSHNRLTSTVEAATRQALSRGAVPDRAPSHTPPRHGLIGAHPSMAQVIATLDAVAHSRASVFIQGENGTGKELLAKAIHAASPRRDKTFLPVDCAALTADDLNQDLFAKADGGTLFLDEISQLSPQVQSRLLRLLHDDPGAARSNTGPDIRVISATCRDPEDEMRRGTLREDLFYRLHVAPITMPPLRARGADVIAIAEAKLAQLSLNESRRFTGFTAPAARALQAYRWPGNVRQLINVIWNVVLTHDAELVEDWMLPEAVRAPRSPAAAPSGLQLDGRTLAEIERDVIEQAIRDHGGSIPRAARALDLSPSTIYRKRESWGKPDKG